MPTNALELLRERILSQPATDAAAGADIPATTAALTSVLNPDMAARATRTRALLSQEAERSSFIAQNRQGNVPLDVESGAPFWQRMSEQFRREPDQKIKFWQDNASNVRPAIMDGKPTGGLIIRVLDDATEKPKDVLVDEHALSKTDLAEFIVGAAPETAGFFLGTRAGKALGPVGRIRGPLGALRDLITGTAGAETVGVVKDLGVRAYDEMPLAFSEVITDRAKEGAISLPVGAAFGLLAKAGTKLITPFAQESQPAIQQQGREAAEYFKTTQGESFPYSAGQKTGSPILQRFEAQTERLPGASKGFEDLRSEQNTVAQRIMNRLIGLPAEATPAERAAMLSSEEVGEAGLAALRSQNQPLENEINLARTKLLERTQRNIENDISAATMPERQLYTDKVGAFVRNRARMEFNRFKTESDALYEDAMSLPGGRDRVLVPKSLASKAGAYLETLPSKEVVTEIPTGVLDAQGKALTRTETGREVLKEFVPDGVLNKLRQLASTEETPFSLQDLVAMRNEVSNAIKQGEAVPGVQTHHLQNIRNMLTSAIHEGADSLPNDALKTAWQKANQFYSQNVQKFHTKLVGSMLKDPTDPGYVGPAGLVQRIISGADSILEAKDFLGAGSKEYAALRRGIADNLFENSLHKGTTTLDANSFLSALSNLRANSRRTFDEVFGSYGDKLLRQSQVLKLGREGAKIDAEAIQAGIRDPSSVPRLRELMVAERAKDEAYRNEILKAVGSNTAPGNLKPAEFVSRFLNSASPKEAKAAMDLIADTNLKWRVRAKAVESLLADAARNPTPQDKVAFRLDPNRIVASDKIEKLLGDPERQRVLEAVLGNQVITDLQNLAKLVRPIEAQQSSFRSAGGIQAGMMIGQFEQGGIIPFAERALVNKFISFLLTVPGPRYAGNTLIQQRGRDYAVSGLMTATPFVEDLISDYGMHGAEVAAHKIGQIFNPTQQPEPQRQPTNSAAEFLNRSRK